MLTPGSFILSWQEVMHFLEKKNFTFRVMVNLKACRSHDEMVNVTIMTYNIYDIRHFDFARKQTKCFSKVTLKWLKLFAGLLNKFYKSYRNVRWVD